MARGRKTAKTEAPALEESVLTATPKSCDTEPSEVILSDAPGTARGAQPVRDQDRQSEADAPHTEEIPLPFTATVNVGLAVLRTAPDSSLMEVRPVGTLPFGTPVTITAIHAESARLRNGLWIKAEFLTPDFKKNTP